MNRHAASPSHLAQQATLVRSYPFGVRRHVHTSAPETAHAYVDGQEQDEPLIQSCTAPAGSCPATRAYTFVAGEFAPGTRRISVVAEDQVGNRSAPIAWDVTVTPGDPQEKMTYGDDGSAPDSYGAVDDGSTACPTDPEAGPEGQYCNADDATNPMDQAVGQEPVGQDRPLLGDLGLLAVRDGSDPPTLRPDGRGWGISDQNALTANNRPGGPPENRDLHMFEDPLFKDTNIRSVRRIVPWDVIARGNTPRTEEMGYPDCRNGTTPSQKIGETNVPIRGDQTSGSERSDLDVLRDWIQEADTAGMEIMLRALTTGGLLLLPAHPARVSRRDPSLPRRVPRSRPLHPMERAQPQDPANPPTLVSRREGDPRDVHRGTTGRPLLAGHEEGMPARDPRSSTRGAPLAQVLRRGRRPP